MREADARTDMAQPGWERADEKALGIECPKCGRTLTSRRMHERGLACEGNCGVKLSQLAAECSRRWQPLSYMFVDVKSGVVKYVGTTKDLPRRIAEHCWGDKFSFERATIRSGDALRLRPQAFEKTLKNGGKRVHVALHASERQLWWSLCTRAGVGPEKNLVAPPTLGVTYRSVRRT